MLRHVDERISHNTKMNIQLSEITFNAYKFYWPFMQRPTTLRTINSGTVKYENHEFYASISIRTKLIK